MAEHFHNCPSTCKIFYFKKIQFANGIRSLIRPGHIGSVWNILSNCDIPFNNQFLSFFNAASVFDFPLRDALKRRLVRYKMLDQASHVAKSLYCVKYKFLVWTYPSLSKFTHSDVQFSVTYYHMSMFWFDGLKKV